MTQFPAARRDLICQQLILHGVDPGRRVPGDVHQDVGLIPEQVGEKICRRTERLSILHRTAQSIHRAHGTEPRRHQEARREAEVDGGYAPRVEGEVEARIVEHSHELIADLLQSGGTGFLPERLKEIVGEG